jgi:hypothetical protein
MSLGKRWDAYWFSPSPLIDLAMCRILIVGYQLYDLALRTKYRPRFRQDAALPDSFYAPLPIMDFLTFGHRPGVIVLDGIYWLTLASGFLSLIGWRSSLSLSIFALGNTFIWGFFYSFSEIHHTQGLALIALAILAFSPAGAAWSVDASRARRAARTLDETSPFARWPLRLIQWMFALIYLSGFVCKAKIAGWDWLDGSRLQYYLQSEAVQGNNNITLLISQEINLVKLASWAVMAFEGTFWIGLLAPGVAWLYALAGFAFHVVNRLLLQADFPHFIVAYCVFVPWTRLLGFLKRARPGRRLASES